MQTIDLSTAQTMQWHIPPAVSKTPRGAADSAIALSILGLQTSFRIARRPFAIPIGDLDVRLAFHNLLATLPLCYL